MKKIYCTLFLLSIMSGVLSSPSVAQPTPVYPTIGQVVRADPRLDALIPAGAKIEVLASGFEWSEGPVWVSEGKGYLLFSDVPRNTVYKWSEEGGLSVFLKPSGYTGIGEYSDEPGSNGLTLDRQGFLVSCEHGDRRVSRMVWGGGKTTIADRYQGKRFNSPNDAVVKSDGTLYFTDPPYGLRKKHEDPTRELEYFGVYRVDKQGAVTLLTKELTRPNGLAFSPDEKTLYVAQSDPNRAIWMAYPVKPDGTLDKGKVFFDATPWVKELPGLPDGMKVDRNGNLFATGPGGLNVFAPDGTHLGRIDTGQATANCGWGNDGSTLYITADGYLCRIRTNTKGAGW
jgi:gluconolactonase